MSKIYKGARNAIKWTNRLGVRAINAEIYYDAVIGGWRVALLPIEREYYSTKPDIYTLEAKWDSVAQCVRWIEQDK